MSNAFFSLHYHHLVRVAVATPHVQVANPAFNLRSILTLADQAQENQADLLLFPELSLSSYSCDDLFHQSSLLQAVEDALQQLVTHSKALRCILVVGAPLRCNHQLFNTGVVIYRGKILGVAAKTYLPTYREFYEKRYFCSAEQRLQDQITLCGHTVPFGNHLLFQASGLPQFSFFNEICEDLWSPIAPSTLAALAGATVLTNLSASNVTIGKNRYRHMLCANQSGKCLAAYLYSAAGVGESSTDLAWDGYAMIYENGHLLSESKRFSRQAQLIYGDIDLALLQQQRMQNSSFNEAPRFHQQALQKIQTITFDWQPQHQPMTNLHRSLPRFPYVPDQAKQRAERCYETYQIQVSALAKRLEQSGIKRCVIGISGGLDSTHALLVACHTMDQLQWPRQNILAYTLPGFATGSQSLQQAHGLMKALGVTAQELDIRPACRQMLADLDHPFAKGEPCYDVTFENVQAGQRTSHLFRLANHHHALVLGTGDLSELALGWATYGVGDHMSHYNVNASLPKTLIQYLIGWVIDEQLFGESANAVLQAIVNSEISPELVPAENNKIQRTEDFVGPYALQDFTLYYLTRYGFSPAKIAFLAWHSWRDAHQGQWPDKSSQQKYQEYDLPTIKKWLGVFIKRFFAHQFKRSCVPNGPKVGSGGSLSPRGDWRAPSDAEADAWLAMVDQIPDQPPK